MLDVAESVLVSTRFRTDMRHTDEVAILDVSSGIGPRNSTPSGTEQPTTRRLEVVRTALQNQGLPPLVVELLLDASRRSTNSAYESAWNSWFRWCLWGSFDPMAPSIKKSCYF